MVDDSGIFSNCTCGVLYQAFKVVIPYCTFLNLFANRSVELNIKCEVHGLNMGAMELL